VQGLSNDSAEDLAGLFRLETCELRSILLPPQPDLRFPFPNQGFTLWVSEEPHSINRDEDPGLLLLIEEFPLSDQAFPQMLTGLSFLSALSVVLDSDPVGDLGSDVPSDPLRTLEFLHGIKGLPKMTQVLYRVRLTFLNRDRDDQLTTIGYPIVVARA
jgi:hypothetical protein